MFIYRGDYMNKLIKLLINYQNTNDEEYLIQIIEMFKELIDKYVSRVDPINKDDIKQINQRNYRK